MMVNVTGVAVGGDHAIVSLVTGLKVQVSRIELGEHLRKRAEYHRGREADKKAQLPKLEEATAAIKSQQPAQVIAQFSKSASNYRFDGDDVVEQLKQDIETHHNKAVAFDWLATHLFDAVYCLDKNDLIELEILKR